MDWADSNRNKLIGDVPAGGTILDRLLQAAAIMKITGRSYRPGKKEFKRAKVSDGPKTEKMSLQRKKAAN